MVSTTESKTFLPDFSVQEINAWLATATAKLSSEDSLALKRALNYSLQLYTDQKLSSGEWVAKHMLGTVTILISQKVDSDTLIAGILNAMPDFLEDYEKQLATEFNSTIAHLVKGVNRIGRFQSFNATDSTVIHAAQIEAWRKMLLAMAEDIRVVIIALAYRLQTMRYTVANQISTRVEIARETLDIFAPLANRLGLWQIKWELEDLSFRVLEPERYQNIARLLEETRIRREQYIAKIVDVLQHELQQAGINANITGRPKHIYSIHKKMQRKNLDFGEIYDARAVRILVDDVHNCYSALGVVHNLWTPIPKEFDDYIAKPKPNDYRSLHTAVTGPEDKVVEVQIRTYEMHQHSELGVAAHWRYKEGAKRDARYEEKIAWLRQILAWEKDVSDSGELAEQFKTALFEDSIYVLTPQGNVIALPKGSTPVDFAYHVHTELGHHCRGAKVDNAMVPLDYPLQNAQQVEIISAKQGGPSRDWLNSTLNYVKSRHARAKIKQWFNRLAHKTTLAQGRTIVEKTLQDHGMTGLSLDKFASKLNFTKLNDFFMAVARGNISNQQLSAALTNKEEPAAAQPDLLTKKEATAQSVSPQTRSDILIVGVDKLLTTLAKCCKPAPPDPIIGFVAARGRGITIHRQSCSNVSRLSKVESARLVEADWGVLQDKRYSVDVEIKAHDRQGLLRDLSDILSREKINVASINTHKRRTTVTLSLTLDVSDMVQLQRVLSLIGNMPGMLHAVRK